MTTEFQAEDGSSPVAVLTLPLEFEAMYVANQEAFHDYALACLGSDQAAVKAKRRAFFEILNHWDTLLEESNLRQQVWAIFRRVVTAEKLRIEMLQKVDAFRGDLEQVDSENGVFPAVRNLPPRQFDVIVLRYVLQYDTKKVSWYMGVSTSTVDYHCRKAKERLEQALPSLVKKDQQKGGRSDRC